MSDGKPKQPPVPSEGSSSLGIENTTESFNIPIACYDDAVDNEATEMSDIDVAVTEEYITEHESPEELIRHLIKSAIPKRSERLDFGDVVASGGVGKIALVRDRALQRQMALKVIKSGKRMEPLLMRGFLREAQITAQLEHPNIVAIHDLDEYMGRPYFTMRLVQGVSLKEWLAESVLVDYETMIDFLEFIMKVCDALDLAHSRGVIHCDLKPANIMVGSYGQVYLMDWGGAELMPSCRDAEHQVTESLPPISSRGKVLGTPAYMAPERARGGRGDERSDVFSIGAILYEFVMGRPPFRDEDLARSFSLAQRCSFQPIDESIHGDMLPKELYRIVHRSMAEEPSQRFQSIAELKNELSRLIRGSTSFPVLAYSPGTAVIREGDPGDAAYIVLSGELEVWKRVDGRKVSLRTLVAGDVFGEMAIFASTPRTANVTALINTKLVRITEEVIRHELDSMKPWMAAFIRTLAERFREREALSLSSKPSQ